MSGSRQAISILPHYYIPQNINVKVKKTEAEVQVFVTNFFQIKLYHIYIYISGGRCRFNQKMLSKKYNPSIFKMLFYFSLLFVKFIDKRRIFHYFSNLTLDFLLHGMKILVTFWKFSDAQHPRTSRHWYIAR